MHARTHLRFGMSTIFAIIALTGWASGASALPCNNTPITVDTTLFSNFEATGTCFVISGDRHLDLNGFTITCAAPPCTTAVQGGGGTRTKVSNGTIDGDFAIAGVSNVHWADSLTVKNVSGTCIELANRTEKNVLLNCGAGIRADMSQNAYVVRNNFISDAAFFGIVANGRPSGSSGSGPSVDHNYIRRSGVAGIFSFVSPSTELQVTDNIVTDDGTSVPIALCPAVNPCADKIIARNICSSIACPVPSHPFTLP